MIDFAKAAESSGTRFDGKAGYMVVGNESARDGSAATFNLFGDAWLAMDVVGNAKTDFNADGAVFASIPVYPLSDGADAEDEEGNPLLTLNDSVHYKGSIPDDVSPLIAGMRTNRSDGEADLTAFDLTLVYRVQPSMHVIWLDRNLDDTGISTDVPVDVYDSAEKSCSATVVIENELNVLWIDQVDTDNVPVNPEKIFFAQRPEPLCVPNGISGKGLNDSAFVTYYLDEYVDTTADRPESSGIAFTLVFTTAGSNENTSTGIDWNGYTGFSQTMLLGHERGLFRQ